jgi:hypothetical protein
LAASTAGTKASNKRRNAAKKPAKTTRARTMRSKRKA